MEYQPPLYSWWYVVGAALLLIAFLCRRDNWPVLMIAMAMHGTPNLQAQWDTSTSATLTFTVTTRACLSVQHRTGEMAFVGCWEKYPASYVIQIGHAGPLSGDVRPAPGDVYLLQTGGATFTAPLVGRPVYLPVLR